MKVLLTWVFVAWVACFVGCSKTATASYSFSGGHSGDSSLQGVFASQKNGATSAPPASQDSTFFSKTPPVRKNLLPYENLSPSRENLSPSSTQKIAKGPAPSKIKSKSKDTPADVQKSNPPNQAAHPNNEEAALQKMVSNIHKTQDAMSDAFKKEITFQEKDAAALAKDLQEVLDFEKTFPQDDKSLYFLIDKQHKVDSSYIPTHLVGLVANNSYNINKEGLSLREDVAASLKKMADAARKDGVTLLVSSTYRSYDYQDRLFQKWVRIDGLEEAERESARPGTSQHQMGSAIDFGSITDDFADTKMGQWMYKHAWEYGWSLSFPKGYEAVTGYRWESWHFRYVGEKACDFQRKWFKDVQQFMLEFISKYKDIAGAEGE